MAFSAVGSGTSISAYVNSLLAKAGANSSSATSTSTGTSAGTSTTATSAATKAAAQAALSAASNSFKSSTAQLKLDHQQTALASDLRSAMAKAGVTLQGSIEMSIGTDGKLKLTGSDKDTAAALAFLKADATKPSFASRVSSLSADADALSTQLRQSAAISQAAKYAGRGGNVMSLYSSLLQQQEATPPVFALSASTSSLSYPGVLASKA